jgi:hypothetical protein
MRRGAGHDPGVRRRIVQPACGRGRDDRQRTDSRRSPRYAWSTGIGPATLNHHEPHDKSDDYIARMKIQLDELNAKMMQVETKAQEAKDDARAKYKEEMAKLRPQSKVAAGKLEDLRIAGEDTWETMVAEMEKIRAAFTHSFHYFKSQV